MQKLNFQISCVALLPPPMQISSSLARLCCVGGSSSAGASATPDLRLPSQSMAGTNF